MAAPTEPGTSTGGHWACRVVDPAGAWVSLHVVRSARRPDRSFAQLTESEAALQIADDATCVARYDAGRAVTGLQLSALVAARTPPLWFLELRETTGTPPAVHLLAFTGHGQAPGALLDSADAAEFEVAADEQLGAVRWYPATGEIDQIYVQPAWRRRSVARALISAANGLSRARDWPWVWGDGQRTELGERWRASQPWRDRAAPLTHVAPPMTPGDHSGR